MCVCVHIYIYVCACEAGHIQMYIPAKCLCLYQARRRKIWPACLSHTHIHTYAYKYLQFTGMITRMMHKDTLKYKSLPEPRIICEIKRLN